VSFFLRRQHLPLVSCFIQTVQYADNDCGISSTVLDTLLTGPRIVAEIGMKIINRPADIIDNPRNVFCDPILHNSSMAKGLVDGVFKIAGKTDVHTSLYGPFGGRHDWMQQRKSYLGNRKINEIIFVSLSLSYSQSDDF